MLHHSPSIASSLLPELRAALDLVRRQRGFDAAGVLEAKTRRIADYLSTYSLKAVVVGLSGGIDSATVLGLLELVRKQHPNVLKKVVPLLMPVFRSQYVVGQDEGLRRASAQCDRWGLTPCVCNLTAVHLAYEQQVHEHFREAVGNAAWAKGQLVSTLRTPALYYVASCLTVDGFPAVVAGTTNRDEGAYLGYMGKASDCMVDLQLIADLHKSEVAAVARQLGVIPEILAAIPTGDMFDGRTDTDVFGAPYDFVELYLAHRCSGFPIPDDWSTEAKSQYASLASNLEALHRFNAHKYLVGSPAVHLNVLPSAVPGGWRE